MAFPIWINRVYRHPEAIVGRLYANDNPLCYSLELPWRDNANNISCIPVGSYNGTIRTDGDKGWRIELASVPKRTHVQLHVGNYTTDILGCILLGMELGLNEIKGGTSNPARLLLKQAYEDAQSPSDITVRITGYP